MQRSYLVYLFIYEVEREVLNRLSHICIDVCIRKVAKEVARPTRKIAQGRRALSNSHIVSVSACECRMRDQRAVLSQPVMNPVVVR